MTVALGVAQMTTTLDYKSSVYSVFFIVVPWAFFIFLRTKGTYSSLARKTVIICLVKLGA